MSEQKKVYTAFSVSAGLHVVLLLLLMGGSRIFSRTDGEVLADLSQLEVTLMPAPTPPEMVIAALPKPPPNVTRSMLESDGLQESKEAPTNAQFESDINSRAASELPARGDAPLPTQDGKERPFAQFTSQRNTLGAGEQPAPEAIKPSPPHPAPTPVTQTREAPPEENAAPRPTPFFTPTPVPTPTPENAFALGKPTPVPQTPPLKIAPLSTPAPQFAKLEPTPPKLREKPQPPQPEPGYQPERERTRIDGNITNRGKNGAEVVATPLGRYKKSIADAVGSRWYYYVRGGMDLINVGDVHIKFYVNEQGRVEDVKIVSNSANTTLGNYCIRSVTEAKIPPLPPDVAPALTGGRLEVDYNFHIYPQ